MTISVKFEVVERHTLDMLSRKSRLDIEERNILESQKKLESIQAERQMLHEMIEKNREFLRTETQRMAADGHNHFSGALEAVDHPKIAPVGEGSGQS